MKRIGVVIIAAIAVLLAVVLLGSSASYRFAAVFDTANGIVAGQQVKIGGVPVGTVQSVQLASGPKARLVLSVERRFAPFTRDATCSILPEGLISEDYVECNPGSRAAGPLPDGLDGLPTIPVAQTSVPASLQDLVNVFSLPVDDRLRVIINELGIATAGRGGEINAILERSNPALRQARRVLAIVSAQRTQLATAVANMDRVLAALPESSQGLRAFVDRAATVMRTTAAHHDELGRAVQRLPTLLKAVRPGLQALDRATVQGTPLLVSLRASAGGLATATERFPAFTAAGIPALNSLASATSVGQAAVSAARPVIGDLARASQQAIPFASNLDQLLINTRDAGGIEGLMSVLYAFATVDAGYDSQSHVLGIFAKVLPGCLASAAAPGCSGAYSAPGAGIIPPDDPACGPQNGALWDPETSCTSILALRRGHRRHVAKVTHPTAPSRPPAITQPAQLPAATSTPRTPVGALLGGVTGLIGSLIGHDGATGASGVTGPIVLGGLRHLLGYLLER